MTMPAMPLYPPPLAEHATTAAYRTGRCTHCRQQVERGDRYALLVPSGDLAHLHCISLMALRPRRAVPVIR